MCGRYIPGSSGLSRKWLSHLICDDCMHSLPRTEQAGIRENSTEMTLVGANEIGRKRVLHIQRAAAFLFYEKDHPVRRAIHAMKYKDLPEIGYALAKTAAMEFMMSDFFDEIDVIIPVPLHPKRLRARGYNQSEYIARGLSEITRIPVDITHLTRLRNTPKQALQDAEGRKTNVKDAFAVNHPEQLYRKHILLVDDLITTGETIRACLQAMRLFRGAQISVFALCKARG